MKCEYCGKNKDTIKFKEKEVCIGCVKKIRKGVGEGELERVGEEHIKKSIGTNKFKKMYGIEIKEDKPAKVFTRSGQAESFGGLQPYFYDKTGMFWLWDKDLCKWEMIDEVDILNMVEEVTGQDVIKSKERTEIINSMKQEGRKRIPKDVEPTWIQFKDKIFDINTGESFKSTPEYFSTNPIPWEVSYDPSTPVMDKIFEEWVGKKNVQTLYEILAYSLLPDYPIHRIFCLIGEGLNGKGCFLRILRRFVGKPNICSTELDTLITSRFEVSKLYRKLVCQMGETNFNELSKTSILKKLTGQDAIGYEFKNKNPFDCENYAKIIIATNSLPTTSDKTIGFYRRWMIIDFPNRFDEKKDVLSEIPEEEYSNLATRCLVTLSKLLRQREFTNEGSIEDRMKKYEDRSDYVRKFVEDMTEESHDGYITKSSFKKRFDEWCIENRNRHLTDKSLSNRMKEMQIESSKRYANWLYEGKGGQMRVWEGIKWKE